MERRTQADRSRTTQEALVRSSRRLFAERGYANVSANDLAAAAGVTRGALYHHYTDKRDLFRAALEEVEGEAAAEIAVAMAAAADRAAALVVGLGRFLDVRQRPEFRRLALIDAPAVLGWAEWRAVEARHSLGVLAGHLDAAVRDGLLIPVPVRSMAQLMLSALTEGALMIAHAPDVAPVRADTERALALLFAGLSATRSATPPAG